jgi:hypothetical protein
MGRISKCYHYTKLVIESICEYVSHPPPPPPTGIEKVPSHLRNVVESLVPVASILAIGIVSFLICLQWS